jgi:diguanylate cyclase (GGDEF)-like protein
MSDRPWSAQGLVGLLDVFALDGGDAVRRRVIDSAAEHLEAEIVGIVDDNQIVRAVGLGQADELADSLIEASSASGEQVSFGSMGDLHVASLPIDGQGGNRFVAARSAAPFSPQELGEVRAMVRIMILAVRTLAAFDEQRQATRRLEDEVARNRELADQLHHRHGDLMTRMLDIQGKLSSSARSALNAIVDQGAPMLDDAVVAIQLLDAGGGLQVRHVTGDHTGHPDERPWASARAASYLASIAIAENRLAVIGSMMAAPVHQQQRAIGAITASAPSDEHQFGQQSQETLLLLAGYASVAVSDALIIEERQQALEQAEWQATHDPLTGLANRRLVIETLDQRLAADETVDVLYIDVDRFKSVNDLYGHQVGDEFIQEVASRLSATVRADDLVGRLAGDEFIVVVDGCCDDHSAAEVLAQRLGDELSHPVEINDQTIALTVSIGLASSDGVTSAGDLINTADVAMYQAKSSGRNRTGVFDEELQRQIRRRAALSERIEAVASAGRGLHLVYQPIVDIETAEVGGHEALLRFVDPELGAISTDEFVSLAEEIGVIASIDNLVIETAIGEATSAEVETSLSINISPAWLSRTDAVSQLTSITDRYQFPLDRLHLEVTERAALAENVTSTLKGLRQLGIRILLDDFGTGYSSLAYIARLEIDGIKIDRGFVDGVETDRHQAAILEAILTLTDRLGAMAIAEGVETAAQAELLSSFGCTLGQGFHFGLPAPAPEGFWSTRTAQSIPLPSGPPS